MATKSTKEKIFELMHNSKQIRNICTCAHIDHGKCIRGDSRLLLSNGAIRTAKSLYEEAQQKGILQLEDIDKKVYAAEGLTIFSLNKSTGRIEKKPVSHAWKLDGGKLIKIKLRNGFSIETTPEHKYVVLDNYEFVDKTAEALKLGDRVVCARKTEPNSDLCIKSYVLKKLSKKNFYAKLKKEFGDELKQKILNKGLFNVKKEIGTELLGKSLYHGAWKNRYATNDLIKLSNLFNIDLTKIYDNIDTICYRTGKRRGKNSLPVKLPHNFSDFFCLAGMLVGDGSGDKFVVGKPLLGELFTKICADLGIKVGRRNYPYRTPELTTNRTLTVMLNALFEYPLKQKSHNVCISELLYLAPKEYTAAFLRGYFDCDGTVEKARRAISLTSVSIKMLNDLKILMSRFSCVPIVQGDTIYLSGLSAKAFLEQIGFNVNEKRERAEQLVSSMIGSHVADILPLIRKNIIVTNSRKLSQIELTQTENLLTGDLSFIEIIGIEETYAEEVYDFTVPDNHNFIAEGIVIHNTTFSDNLMAGAGMISEELAGKMCVLDFDEQEKARGITINAANVSMVHEFNNEDYLINLIDTPGHVDFGGDVTRAMRAVDGAIVLCCAVEGVMPQTETVLRQALKERVKPILFINKVDRLIKELKLTPEAMQERFVKNINYVNKLIKAFAPPEFKEKWLVNVANGSVAFGSAYHKWALSIPMMQKKSITFKEIIDAYLKEDEWKKLAAKAPLHEVILDMVIRHLPNPADAQKYRIPKLWSGDLESPIGKSLLACDDKGPLVFIVTRITEDPQAGEIATGRLFSGEIKRGQDVFLNNIQKSFRVQQVSIYKGAQRIAIEGALAGNIVGVTGLKEAGSGETVSTEKMQTFEKISHLFEPVVTKAIEAKSPKDLPKLIEVLREIAKQDPTIAITINEETGENLISGLGELHLEIWEYRIRKEKGLEIVTSPPIVVYRESVPAKSPEVEGKSPNKHNKFYVTVEPLEDSVYEAIKSGNVPERRVKKKDNDFIEALVSAGMSRDDARNVKEIYNGNVLLDNSKGIVQIGEVIEMVMDAFEEACRGGPLAKEPITKLKVCLSDMKLHEDAIHRGPAQVIPAMRGAIFNGMLTANAVLYEPVQTIQIDAPLDFFGNISKLVQNRRGQLLETNQEGEHLTVHAKVPVGEMFGFASALRSSTEGRGSQSLIDQHFERMPSSLQTETVLNIRKRKGMKAELPKPQFD